MEQSASKSKTPDVAFANHGSIVTIRPLSRQGADCAPSTSTTPCRKRSHLHLSQANPVAMRRFGALASEHQAPTEINPMIGHIIVAAAVTAFGGFFLAVGYAAFAALARRLVRR
jgi:hypothetical protein